MTKLLRKILIWSKRFWSEIVSKYPPEFRRPIGLTNTQETMANSSKIDGQPLDGQFVLMDAVLNDRNKKTASMCRGHFMGNRFGVLEVGEIA